MGSRSLRHHSFGPPRRDTCSSVVHVCLSRNLIPHVYPRIMARTARLSHAATAMQTLLVPARKPSPPGSFAAAPSPSSIRFHLYFLPYNPLTDYRQPSADGTAQPLNTTWLRNRCTPNKRRTTHMDWDLQRWRREREELKPSQRTGLPAVERNVTFSGYTNPDASGCGYLARVHRLPHQCSHVSCVRSVVPGMAFQYVLRPLQAVAGDGGGRGGDSSQHQSGGSSSWGGASGERWDGGSVMRQQGVEEEEEEDGCSGGSCGGRGAGIWAQRQWQEHLEVVTEDQDGRWLQPCDCNSRRHAGGDAGKEREGSEGEAPKGQGYGSSNAPEEGCGGLR